MSGFNQWLGIEPDGDGIALETRPEHEVAPGLVHFAVLTTLAEVAAATSVGVAVVPTSVQISLMRRAEPGRLQAVGTLVKLGRTLAFAEGEVRQNGQVVAKAAITFAVIRGEAADGP